MMTAAEGPHRVRCGEAVPGPAGATARILVAGDTHGNLDWIDTLAKLASRQRCDGILQAGDFGFWPDLRHLRSHHEIVLNDGWLDAVAERLAARGVWMRVIDGNHDAHGLAAASCPPGADLVAPVRSGLLDWATRGARWSWCGVRFGALGGAVSVDRDNREEGISWWPTERITDEDVDRLGDAPLDVLVTHDAPEGVRTRFVDIWPDGMAWGKAGAVSEASRWQVERARQATRPRLVVHGHYHLRHTSPMSRPPTVVEGLASDQEADGGSWAVLELPSLRLTDGKAIARAVMRAIAEQQG